MPLSPIPASVLPQNAPIRSQPNRRSTLALRPKRAAPRMHRAVRSVVIPTAAALADATAILAVTWLISLVFRQEPFVVNDTVFGSLLAALFVGATVARHGYAVSHYLKATGQMRHAFNAWSLAFVAVIAVGFFTKTGQFFSRGFAALVLVAGLVTVLALRLAVSQGLRTAARRGALSARSIFLVGDEASLHAFTASYDFRALGLDLLGAAVIRPDQHLLKDDLALAAASARMLRPRDIFILAPWHDRGFIERCIDTFMRLPASIHLGPESILQQFADMHIVRNGPLSSVHLMRSPLSTLEVAVKRGFDLAVACTAVVLLSPLLAIVAVLIKIDSQGPVLFRQTRYGFNQEPFRILKFRSMITMEDGAAVRQATRGDVRITRVGAWLRRSNIDELPQLFNVIRGDMSLVGPRPHAMAHDQAFERSVSRYARRHNVRPGITGWAQVNGWRGETNTDDKIRGRIAYDLYYVDNWSLWLDIVVLARTLVSPRAYLNAG